MEIEGRILFDLGIQEGTSKAGKPWKKQEWVLETLDSQYPRKVKFTVFGDMRVDQLKFVVGSDYRVSVDVESREYMGRWYTDVNAYAATPLNAQPMGAPAAPEPVAPFGGSPAPAGDPFAGGDNNTDDLPF